VRNTSAEGEYEIKLTQVEVDMAKDASIFRNILRQANLQGLPSLSHPFA
jgi:hypothetical protein